MSAVTLHSPLSRAQCVERLRDAADPWWKPFRKKRASGAVGTQRFWLMKRIGYNNSWQTIMQGRFEDDAQGTRIACRFGLSVFTFVLQVVLFGFAGAVLAVWIVAAVEGTGDWTGVPAASVFCAAAVGMSAFGRWLARDERTLLTQFVCEVCDAKIVAGPVR